MKYYRIVGSELPIEMGYKTKGTLLYSMFPLQLSVGGRGEVDNMAVKILLITMAS